jgi:hypothetical protein
MPYKPTRTSDELINLAILYPVIADEVDNKLMQV